MELDRIEKLTQELDYYFNNLIKKRCHAQDNEHRYYHVGILVLNDKMIIDIEYLRDVNISGVIPPIPVSILYVLYNKGNTIDARNGVGPYQSYPAQLQKIENDIIEIIMKYSTPKSDILFTHDVTRTTITFNI